MKAIQFIIVSVKLAASIIAIVLTVVLVHSYGFHWYTALAFGILAYISLKAIFAAAVGYFWGQRDARFTKRFMESLPPEARQDVIDHMPASDVKELLKKYYKE